MFNFFVSNNIDIYKFFYHINDTSDISDANDRHSYVCSSFSSPKFTISFYLSILFKYLLLK